VILTLAATGAVTGQSLGELAKQEEARRKAIQTPAKIYTNDSIRGGVTPARPAPATASPAPVPPFPGCQRGFQTPRAARRGGRGEGRSVLEEAHSVGP
jgi:hypothetical protein